MKPCLKGLAIFLCALLIFCAGYIAYVLLSFQRLGDQALAVESACAQSSAQTGEEYTLLSWNMGFGAYSADYSFFMDGGKYARALSEAAVIENTTAMLKTIAQIAPDFALLQEVDISSTRSRLVNQMDMVSEAFPEMARAFAVNYDSSYLLYPINEPIGRSYSGIMTLSSRSISEAARISLPVETGLMKFFDLDRCYSVSRIPVENGKTLCLYNLHLSAYTSDGEIATEQLSLLLSDMQREYASGNYAVAGGDFNKDLLGNSGEIFGVSADGLTWALPFPEEMLPGGIALAAPDDNEKPVPSCRNADAPYQPGTTFVLTVDGFLVSQNVEVFKAETLDLAFANSDHNPVVLNFRLRA